MYNNMFKEKLKKLSLQILQYVFPYFLGIFVAIIFTPVELSLAGHSLWYWYPVLAVPAFCLLFTQFSRTSSVLDLIFAFIYLVSIACVLFGITSHFFDSLHRYRPLGSKLIGFSFGFIGTIGVYFIAAGSI